VLAAIRKLFMVSSGAKYNSTANSTCIIELNYHWIKGSPEVRRLEEELEKDEVCHRFDLTYRANTLPPNPLKRLETSKRHEN
jgi:hypothetical protein